MALLGLSGTPLLVLLLGATLLVGFGADWLASRFRVPDVLWLIALGFVAGPVLGLLSASSLLVIAPVLGATTLMLILFDAGLDLRISRVRPLAGSALLFALTSYVASVAVIYVAGYLVLFPKHSVLSLLFATALGCTSGAVIIPLANRLGLATGLRSFLQLDGAVEDALAVITVTTILALRAPSSSSLALSVTASLVLPLPVGIGFGLAAGLIWLLFLYAWQNRPFVALATLGFLFVTFAVTEAFGGSGILAAIIFGVVVGNEELVRPFLRRSRPFQISNDLRKVEVEIAFVLRSFFLFLIGLFAVVANPGLVESVTLIVLVAVLLFLRQGVVLGVTRPRSIPRAWSGPIASFYGRGLTSAVLLIVALEQVPEVSQLFLPGLLLIVGTNIAMTLWLFASPTRPEPSADEAERRWAAAAPELIAFSGEDATALAPDPAESRTAEDLARVPSPGGSRAPPPLPRRKE